MKIDFNKKMEDIISRLAFKPKLLLHSCCAPCSSSVLERLAEKFEVVVFYSNSNIYPKEEYQKRFLEQKTFLKKLNIDCVEDEYCHNDFLQSVKGLEGLGEKSERCKCCYKQRLRKTAIYAKQHGFDYFCTTLSLSPHKNSNWVNEIGLSLEKEYGIKFLPNDFKKKNGFLRSLELSRINNFYRQNYCGCEFSKKETLGE